MLSLFGPGVRLCDGWNRREVMRIGGLGFLGAGLNLTDLLRTAATADGPMTSISSFGRARSCILLFLMGGPPQHSTWDPKPDAPAEVRGDFGPIATTVPGLSISELLPRTALVADKLCILRAVSTGDNAHSSSGYYMLTGRPHQPMNFENANPGAPNDAPSLGAVLRRISKARGGLPLLSRSRTGSSTPMGVSGRARMRGSGPNIDPWLLNARLTPGIQIQEIDLPADIDQVAWATERPSRRNRRPRSRSVGRDVR